MKKDKLEDILQSFAEWYKENGNYIGGFAQQNIPEEMLKKAKILKNEGYVEKWDTNTDIRYILKVDYRIPYDWEKLYKDFYAKNKFLPLKEFNEKMEDFERQRHYLDGNWETKNKKSRNDKEIDLVYKLQKKYINKMIEKADVEELKEYVFRYSNYKHVTDLKHYNHLLSLLEKANTKSQIERLFEYKFYNKLFKEYIVIRLNKAKMKLIANCDNKKTMKKVIDHTFFHFCTKEDKNKAIFDKQVMLNAYQTSMFA